jgi:hypothetical protein
MGRKYMRQHIHEYLKTSIYRLIVNSKGGLAAENIKKKLSVTIVGSEEFDACMKELKEDDLITCDKITGLWIAS